ncbi:MAG: adenylate/guanylate cyclase domain-containing protein [Anaerolineales bacterium]|nr:adenylate/guanylate cyclase domain-containing protein [Anaerolineales bacterium]
MLFVDVRGSTTIAEKMDTLEFSRLMNRFYEAAINVLVRANALIDKLVGDEVTALFIPGFAGEEHSRKAVQAGQSLLRDYFASTQRTTRIDNPVRTAIPTINGRMVPL